MKIRGVIEDLTKIFNLKNDHKNISQTKELSENKLTPHCLQQHQRKS